MKSHRNNVESYSNPLFKLIYNLNRVILSINIVMIMDDFKDYFYLGKVVKTHGYEGKLSIYLDTDEPNEYASIDTMFLNIRGNLVPYFIQYISILNNKATVNFLDVDDIEKAEGLINKEIYLPVTLLPELSGNKFYYHEVINMMVTDDEYGELGPINAVLEYPNQAVLQVYHQGKEVLIPISDEIIINVDRKQNKMAIKAPEGLLDIYIKG